MYQVQEIRQDLGFAIDLASAKSSNLSQDISFPG
jgi:hypothetical protein